MGSGLQLRSLGKFLYTQNPFYLISCFLIIYGLQIATVAQADLASRSILLAIGTTAYTLLMAVTCVAVVRIGNVWEDARSIFLVVVISFIAFSIGIDELCVVDWNLAAMVLVGGGLLVVAVTEAVLRACRLRLPAWYRVSFYASMAVFFISPLVLGNAVAQRHDQLANAGSMLFSAGIGGSLLLLIPAIRGGKRYADDNGTPWRYPLYPLSLFVVIAIVAVIRTHAIWMSFGFLGQPVQFEPMLILPIAFSVLALILEVDAGPSSEAENAAPVQAFATGSMFAAPGLLLCSLSPGGKTHLPFHADLVATFGSSATLCMMALLLFYAYAWLRRVHGAGHAVVASLMGISLFGTVPETAESFGVRSWMLAASATSVYLVMCLRSWRRDQLWLGFVVLSTATVAMAGRQYTDATTTLLAATGFAVLGMMAIGAAFDSELAEVLRGFSAVAGVLASAGVFAWYAKRMVGNSSYDLVPVVVMMAIIVASLVYIAIVRRTGWWYVIGIQSACLAGMLGWYVYRTGALRGANFPLSTGLACFVVGITITSAKTGAYRRWIDRGEPDGDPTRRFKQGF